MHNNSVHKTCKDSLTSTVRVIMPGDTNFFSNLMGGNLMNWMDELAAICAMKHSCCKCVTASVDNLTFKKSILLGATAKIEGYVTRAFKSSMEVYIRVFQEWYVPAFSSELTNEAYYTFVAIDEEGKPIPVAAINPETEEEKAQHAMALKRRKIRLYLDKRIQLEAAEISELFSPS